MYCPLCNVELRAAGRQGVEVNCCPECRGVWIDRGGLDKIIDRFGACISDSRPNEGARQGHKHYRYHDSAGRHRKWFFSDLFD
jgi:Zn-finger nucleic acid-binding protein